MSIQPLPETEFLGEMVTQTGVSVFDLSSKQPTVLMFLRHFGCVFCKEALADISQKIKRLKRSGAELVFVHMSDPEIAESYFGRFGLGGSLHISDPECKFYTAFGLRKGSLSQLFGLKNWIRGFSIQVNHGFPMEYDKTLGDAFQMPGTFVVFKGRVEERFIHTLAGDRPDYDALISRCQFLLEAGPSVSSTS